MKKIFSFFWGLLFCIVQGVTGSSFSLVTWNLLGPNAPDVDSFKLPANTAKWNFTKGDMERLAIESDFLQKMNAAVICLQECDKNFKVPTVYELASFQEKRGSNGAGVGLWYKPSVMECVKAGGEFFTIPKPGTNESRNACAWGVFNNIRDIPIHVLICSVHLGRSNDRSDIEIGKKILEALAEILKKPIERYRCTSVIIAGDFNTNYEELANVGQSYLVNLFKMPFVMYQHRSWTVNGNSKFDFKNKKSLTEEECEAYNFEFAAIDHVMYTDGTLNLILQNSFVGFKDTPYFDARVSTAEKKLGSREVGSGIKFHELFPSDHLPIFATFEFKQSSSAKASPASGKLQKYSPEEIKELENRAAGEINDRLEDVKNHIDVMLHNEAAIKQRMPDANKSNVVHWLPKGFEYFEQLSEPFLIDTAKFINKLIDERRLAFKKTFSVKAVCLPKDSAADIEKWKGDARKGITKNIGNVNLHIDNILKNEGQPGDTPSADKFNVVDTWLPQSFEEFGRYPEEVLIDTAEFVNRLIAQRRVEFNKSSKLLELALELAASL